jgi:hypothetical protein
MALLTSGIAPASIAGAASTAELMPPSASWLAFCGNVDAGAPRCDPIPVTDAMPDGPPVSSPPGWRAYCAANRGDEACGS